jgi:ADP-dependent NAD(P)H-hydrate dehydratase / NAD(P)H-hydrate epimerase
MTGSIKLPTELFTAEQVRSLDQRALSVMGIDSFSLMERAGAAAFDLISERWPDCGRIIVVAGPGNNGGDAFVVARLARRNGVHVDLYAIDDPAKLKGAAAEAYRIFSAEEGAVRAITDELPEADLIVDGLFGTGLTREVEGRGALAIQLMNAHPAPVIALDLPSGLSADTGAVMGAAVSAACTITFVGMKCGLLTAAGPSSVGELHFAGLGLPPEVAGSEEATAVRMDRSELQRIPARKRNAHKGNNGHVLLIGGDQNMGGAMLMAGQAALRSGAGLVTLATRETHRSVVLECRPELMVAAVDAGADLAALIERAGVIAIGPGLGQDAWGRSLFETAITADRPMVVDADALNLLAGTSERRDDWVLTPHPAEAARLLNTTTREIEGHRFDAVTELQARYGGVVILKGAGSLIAGPNDRDPIAVCPYGNPGMATAGMGDLLTGVVAALLAQFKDAAAAARWAVLAHAIAGDRVAADGGERGLIATDLLDEIRTAVNP